MIKFRFSNVDDLTLGRTTTIHQLLSRAVQARLLTGSLAIDQALGTAFVEAYDPVPDDLERHIAETGCI
ncbi:hypothetical protein ASF03_12075 [Rhizobium sp. Leaf68]|nr:hypothetical protein ASE62_11395 [Rhizobium sp. Leaf202]KQN84025.1 hypothetical protein ASF03_12075 [Rhizobium sp. Leaf68]